MKIKLSIQELKRETFKLLGACFGLSNENGINNPANKSTYIPTQTPDFYNSRINGRHRKNMSPNRFPE